MKKSIILFLLFIVVGGYDVHYPQSHGSRTDRHFTEIVHAENRAHAVNQVLFALRSKTRRNFYIQTVKKVSK